MREEKGQAVILVIILLAVGALLIVPTLRYASAGLDAYRISKELTTEQYSAGAAIEDAMWRLKYNEYFPYTIVNRDSLTTSGESVSYAMIVNDIQVVVTVSVPSPPATDHTEPPGNPERLYAYIERDNGFVPQGGTETMHIVVVPTGTATTFAREVWWRSSPDFEYVSGTSLWYRTLTGTTISLDDLTDIRTEVIGGETWLVFDIPTVPERIGKDPDTATLSFDAGPTASNEGGIYYSQAKALYAGQGQLDPDQFLVGTSAPVWVGMYHIKAVAGKVTITASVALNASYELRLLSWQEE